MEAKMIGRCIGCDAEMYTRDDVVRTRGQLSCAPCYFAQPDEPATPIGPVAQLITWIGQMSDDEVEVVHAQAAQMMGEGRKEYGELNLATDKRELLDMIREAKQEHDDHSFYARCAMIKIERLAKELFGAEA